MIGVVVVPESVVERECWLYAHVCDGRLYVNRSVLVRDTDPIFQPVRDITGDAEPVEREMVADPNMMLCRAIREIYDVQ